MNDASRGERLSTENRQNSPQTAALPHAGTPPAKRRLARLVPLVVATGVLAGIAYWLYGHWTGITIYDARVTADVVAISSRVNGWVVGIDVEEAQRIERGQVLVRVDGRESQLKIREIDARIASLKAEKDRLVAEIDLTERRTNSEVAAANANLSAQEAALAARVSDVQLAQRDLERANSLIKRAVMSKQQWETTQTLYEKSLQEHRGAEAAVARARAAVAQAETGRNHAEVLRRKLAAVDHDIATQMAQRAQQVLDFEDRAVKSPSDGIVDRVFVDPGEYVTAGQRLMLIHDPDKIWVSANVKETEIGLIGIGSTAKITVDAYPDMVVEGKVVRLGQAATSQFALLPNPNPSGNFTKITQRLPVKIAIDQVDGLLRPGMMVEVHIAIERH
jgi:membrane fusion protein (multidrug efflux system)